ncbi:MAG: 16S rRNA (cytosine(967)-C(5))-methyltransferase RsmB [Verrucomicrobia bacterium]|nr:16S rRNA (cytosine(967)-C(5))-methyltransferase RsmB [Verrucomicrobiota bacterium]MDE3099707.1 16S rRNA (cytosine(967)-C(5))-methyltransferase RsmB [Verrucomicrobiota bacterium]
MRKTWIGAPATPPERPLFTERLLLRAFSNAALSAPDRALCQELVYGVVRWRATLDALIDRKTGARPQKIPLQNCLRLGLFQIFWLRRIPPHAAVHETVETAKRLGLAAQAGFINAVLRSCLREAEQIQKLLDSWKTSRPALGWSHPDWLVEKWSRRFGPQNTLRLLEWNNTPPKTFARVNALKIDAARLLETWRSEGVQFDFWPGPAHLRGEQPPAPALPKNLVFELKSHPPLASLKSFQDGWFYIQDPATLFAPLALDPQPGATIWDVCAAPGGKTTFIAQCMANHGLIMAGDTSKERLKLLRENCQRLGVTIARFPSDLGRGRRRNGAGNMPLFDKILLDAPCSNTGVLRRRVDLRWRLAPAEIHRLAGEQFDLLESAAARLKPDGILVYSTCSLEPEENGQVLSKFLASDKRFVLEWQREILPFADGVDGAFIARLRRDPNAWPRKRG